MGGLYCSKTLSHVFFTEVVSSGVSHEARLSDLPLHCLDGRLFLQHSITRLVPVVRLMHSSHLWVPTVQQKIIQRLHHQHVNTNYLTRVLFRPVMVRAHLTVFIFRRDLFLLEELVQASFGILQSPVTMETGIEVHLLRLQSLHDKQALG